MRTSPNNTTRFAIGALTLLGLAAPAGGQVSNLDDILLYGINNDPPVELVRYAFSSDLLTTIGEVRDQFGFAPPEMEAFTYIPEGPNMGYYASSNYNAWTRSRLIKVNDQDASAFRYPNDIGFGFIVGMTAYKDASGDWRIYATHRGKVRAPADPSTPGYGSVSNLTNLISIDPVTGIGTHLHTITQASATAYQGLALGPDGLLYGVTNIPKTTLRTMDPANGYAEAVVVELATANMKLEALEWCFGDFTAPAMDCSPDVPLGWTGQGALFTFSDEFDLFPAIDPVTGATQTIDCAFKVTDAEGLVFFVPRTDPRNAVDEGYD